GWDMPVQYSEGVVKEHLATRTAAGAFDVSHMGRLELSGAGALPFLQHVLTNNAKALEIGEAQYTLIQDGMGNAIDDAYLYRTGEDSFTLVVNAANREKDLRHFEHYACDFEDLQFKDRTYETAMISLQGPNSEKILEAMLDDDSASLPEAERNKLSTVTVKGYEVRVARTGYTGEPVCFELITENENAANLWETILSHEEEYGVKPIGLGARDTLRLEAHLPLYGHELGTAPDGSSIPIYAISLAKRTGAVSFAEEKGNFVGKEALWRQAQERKLRDRFKENYTVPLEERALQRVVMPMAVMNKDLDGPGRKPPRNGYEVVNSDGDVVGHITSGTTVPCWEFEGEGVFSAPSEDAARRPIALAYLNSNLFPSKAGQENREVYTIRRNESDTKGVPAFIVTANSRAMSPYVHPVTHPEQVRETPQEDGIDFATRMQTFAMGAAKNTKWRQTKCFNLIPSENTPSPLVRALSIMDPAGRYAEHQFLRAFGLDSGDASYYQGTGFAMLAEQIVTAGFASFLGATQVEPRPISGQQANMAVYCAIVQHLNRGRLKGDDLVRMQSVLTNALRRGGHLSSQYFGALRDYVAIDPSLQGPAVHSLPVCEGHPYRLDVAQMANVITQREPNLIVLGKSMILEREPVAEIAQLLDEMYAGKQGRPILMYDGAHVLGLLGQHFQQPLAEGADFVTGSTHKTFPGTQRGVIASRMSPGTEHEELWNAAVRSEFPGMHSNHHLGTMVGQVAALYEMREFGDAYQQQVISNSKAFAQSLVKYGISVEGDPSIGYTETHQVVINVGLGDGPEIAERLEQNGIITNNQALPSDHGFSYASGIRMGVQEMTRFGMNEEHFDTLARYMADVVITSKPVVDDIAQFREQFTEMRYTLPTEQAEPLLEMLRTD
ncbi:MAG: glycine cleavage system protein T, partial [Candidatus Marinimicrobia bacterium]|nr:glycine cleavage system protein T [Candidatus Neomarinimicrobiota bacterium]